MPAVLPAPEPRSEPLVELFRRHRAVHPYGLADLDEPYWRRSRWWRRGDAVVGEVGLPDDLEPIVYAVSADDPAGTLDLLAELAVAELPARFVMTGPCGLGDRLAPTHEVRWSSPHRKFHLRRPELLPADGDRPVRTLGPADVPALLELFATDPDAGDFFHPGLLASGHYRGVDDDGRLAAVAGVHVVSPANGVAAVGNVATHPAHRRRGLARAALARLCRDLLAEVDVVGLNVKTANVGAQRLYEAIGFEPVIDYDEAELVRRPASAT